MMKAIIHTRWTKGGGREGRGGVEEGGEREKLNMQSVK